MTYKTVHSNQTEILKAIDALYLNGQGIYCDPMYGKGGFYKDFPEPTWAYDIQGGKRCDGSGPLGQGNAAKIPWDAGSFPSMILDPPFMHAQGKDSALRQYTSYPSQKALHAFYRELIAEAARVLVRNGILIFKTQDTVESGKQVMTHIVVHDLARQEGFKVEDLFILTARSRLIGHNHSRQRHARKFHAYFWAFRKTGRVTRPNRVLDANGLEWVQMPIPQEVYRED